MLEPPVQYARTSDGVNIAFTAFGNSQGGVPLICLRSPQLSHMALEFKLPFQTNWKEFETLAKDRLVVRFDTRGSGLSDRGISDISLVARSRDICAVAEKLGIKRFALQGQLHAGSWAIHHAATFPDQVSHLILVQTYTRGAEYWGAGPRAALQPLAELDWNTYTEASMSNAFSWAPGDLPRALAAQMRASVDQRDFVAFLREDAQVDVTDDLARVQCPALVVHFELDAVTTQPMAMRLAAAMPDGRLSLPRHFREGLAAYNSFLDERPDERTNTSTPESLRIFLVAAAETPPGQLEREVERFGGLPVSSIAGVTTAVFGSAQSAIECGRALTAELDASVGVHAAEATGVASREADPALLVAVRAAGLAGRGRLVVSNIIRELTTGKGFAFEPLSPGDEDDEAIRLFTLR